VWGRWGVGSDSLCGFLWMIGLVFVGGELFLYVCICSMCNE
jgi:hypothetical protein